MSGDRLTRASVPEDMRDTYDFIVEMDSLGDSKMANDARLAVRKSTLGEAVEVMAEKMPGARIRIKMPIPRTAPWVEMPALMVGGHLEPGVTLRLNDYQVANLLELFKAMGWNHGGIEPFTAARGDWTREIGFKLSRRTRDEDYENVVPDQSVEELAERIGAWRYRLLDRGQ